MKKQFRDKKKQPGSDSNSQNRYLEANILHDKTEFDRSFWKGPVGEKEPSEDLKRKRKEIGVVVKPFSKQKSDEENYLLEKCPAPIKLIEDTHMPDIFKSILKELSISTLTTVQQQCWPAILSGANLIAIAPTGSGKTLGFSLPMIPHITARLSKSASKRSLVQPIALVLEPTRELAIQVASVLKILRRQCNINSAAIFGGQDKEDQLESIKPANGGELHILISTPGRLIDHLQSKSPSLSLSKVSYLVVDEADRMLSLGFFEQLLSISGRFRPDRQTLLFSATFPGALRESADRLISNSIFIRCNSLEFSGGAMVNGLGDDDNESNKKKRPAAAEVVVNDGEGEGKLLPSSKKMKAVADGDGDDTQDPSSPEEEAAAADDEPDYSASQKTSSLSVSRTVEQLVHICAAHKKPRLLLKYITAAREKEKSEKVRQQGPMLIFCNKIKTLKFVKDFLARQEIACDLLHGQLPQPRRESILKGFQAGKVNILIATDVVARGIHIKRLRYVVNYDFPSTIEQYCHRVGRTGRQGEAGFSYSLLTRNMAPLARGLISLLSVCDQKLEPNLIQLAEEFEAGDIECEEEEEEDNDDEKAEEKE